MCPLAQGVPVSPIYDLFVWCQQVSLSTRKSPWRSWIRRARRPWHIWEVALGKNFGTAWHSWKNERIPSSTEPPHVSTWEDPVEWRFWTILLNSTECIICFIPELLSQTSNRKSNLVLLYVKHLEYINLRHTNDILIDNMLKFFMYTTQNGECVHFFVHWAFDLFILEIIVSLLYLVQFRIYHAQCCYELETAWCII